MLSDLERLKVFYFVYARGSVVGAGEALHITQSAVSQRLKKLEQELGALLFTRLHKKLVPTREGTALFELVAPFMERLSEGLQDLQQMNDEPGGLLRLGAPVEFGQNALPVVLAEFRKAYPRVRFALSLGHPSVLLPRLSTGELDLTFADIFLHRWEERDKLSLFAIEPMFEEALVLVGSREYCEILRGGSEFIGLEHLLDASYIAYAQHAPSIRSWMAFHLTDDRTARPSMPSRFSLALVVESVRAAIAAVKAGMGLAIVPSHLLHVELDAGEVEVISHRDAEIVNRISLIQLQDKVPTLTERRFVHFCRESFGKLPGGASLTSGGAFQLRD